MKKVLLTVLIIALSVTFLSADVYIKQKIHTDAVSMMGQNTPAKDSVTENWIGENIFASHNENQSVIMDLSKKKMIMINHGSKTYIPMELPVDLSKYMPPQLAQMMQSMTASVTVEVTTSGETRKISNWVCQEYHVDMNMMMMKMKMKVWATKDVPFDWKMISQKMLGQLMKAQMRLNDSAVKEMMKIEGYWIASETTVNVMGNDVKSSSMVTEIVKKDPGADTYSVPAGYTQKEKFSMADIQKK